MSNESGTSDEDSQSRKRHWLAEDNEKTRQVSKKRQKKGFVGFLFTPFNNFLSMFGGNEERERAGTSSVGEVDDNDSNDDDIVVEKTVHVIQDTRPVIYLNSDSPEEREERRAAAGGEEEADVVIEKLVQRNVEVSDDSDSDDVQEITATPTSSSSRKESSKKVLNRSFEKQQDDEPSILFEKVVKTPNRELQAARRFQDELIYLNEAQDSSDDVSVASAIGSTANFESPTPDDSASRTMTPMSLANYSSNTVRDFWRRSSSSASKRTARAGAQFRQPFRHKSSIQRVASGVQKAKRPDLSSRDRLLQGVVASGQYEAAAILGLNKSAKKTTKMSPSTADVIARANNKIQELRGSRSTTPSISRESSVIFEGSSFKDRQRTPSISSIHSQTPAQQKVKDLISQIDNLGIRSTHRGPQRYEHAYESSKRKEDVLLEEARIRQGHRAQTRGERLEQTRKNLQLIGIVQRPKIEKKKIDDFMALPDESDTMIEKAWNRGMNPEEKFVELFAIPICRKDLDTLRGLNWLNDNVINVYLQLICDRSTNNANYPKTYAFNTFFYTNIVSKGYASVKRWTRKVDIFAHDVILIPVHLGMHWCMAVIDMPQKKLEFYDSLYDGNTQVLPALQDYIASESLDKKKTPFDFAGWTIQQMEDIPRQQNGSDCGVFSCQFGEWASRRTAPRFTQKNMPYYRKRMVYEILSNKLLATI